MKFLLDPLALAENLIKMSGHEIPESVNKLIDIVVREKTRNLEYDFYLVNKYLPKQLQKINLENKILSTNIELQNLSKEFNFDRIQENDFTFLNENNTDEEADNENESKTILIRYCLHYLDKEEYNQYLKFEITDEKLFKIRNWYRRGTAKKFENNLPKFELITDYLGLMSFFDSLIQDFEDLNSSTDELSYSVESPSNKYRFKTNLTESKIQNLFEMLIDKECISPQTSQEEFLWIFGVDNSKVDIGYIEWLKSKSMAVYFIDMLYAFNFLTNFEKMWAIGSRVFGIKNMAQIKQNYISTNSSGKPKGYAIMDEIISSL